MVEDVVVEAAEVVEEVNVVEEVEVVEEIAAAPEAIEEEADDIVNLDNDRNDLNLIDASGDAGGFQRANGTGGDDLILTSGQSASFVNAGAGDDTIIVQGSKGFNTDFVNTGAGRDTVVLSDDTEFVTFSHGNFDVDEGVIDLSGVSGISSFDELAANLRDDLVVANEAAGALEIQAGNGPVITFIDPDDADGLSEDNFIFSGDDAVVG